MIEEMFSKIKLLNHQRITANLSKSAECKKVHRRFYNFQGIYNISYLFY